MKTTARLLLVLTVYLSSSVLSGCGDVCVYEDKNGMCHGAGKGQPPRRERVEAVVDAALDRGIAAFPEIGDLDRPLHGVMVWWGKKVTEAYEEKHEYREGSIGGLYAPDWETIWVRKHHEQTGEEIWQLVLPHEIGHHVRKLLVGDSDNKHADKDWWGVWR